MNRLLLYLNETLESLDIPPLTKVETKYLKTKRNNTLKKIKQHKIES